MRIISGRYRGRKIMPPENSDIRPTTDRAKEALFNILVQKIGNDCVFLDLFSGSGAIGIEALSRGAKKVYFVDSAKTATDLIKKNLKNIDGDYEILNMDYKKAIKYLQNQEEKLDIVYCDPPYKQNLGKEIIDCLAKSNIINFDGRVIIERNKINESYDSNLLYLYDTRKYAGSVMDFYKREKRCAITGTFDPFTNGHLDLVRKAKEIFDRVYIVLLINQNKKVRYSLEKRKEIINIAIKHINQNVVIDNYDGLAIDYCNNNDIQYILRGIRNFNELDYEWEMAMYNYKNGNVTTLIMPAKSIEISSTLVKKKLDREKDISTLVDEDIIKILKE